MAKKTISDADDNAKKKKMPEGIKFTTVTAKQAQQLSVKSRNLRKQVRAQMLQTIVSTLDLGEEMRKAIINADLDRINVLNTAIKILGLHQDQSDERAKQTISATAETKPSADGMSNNENSAQTLKLQFEIVDPEPEEEDA